MCLHYVVTKGSCSVGSDTPVEVALCVICYTARRVAVVHRLDEVSVNGGCPNFKIFFYSLT